MDVLLADLRQSVRVLLKHPSVTVMALATLALGIGANTAIFSVVNAVLLKPLPYPEPDRLVQVVRSYRSGGVGTATSIPKFVFWRDHSQSFESLAASDSNGPGLNLSGTDTPEQIRGVHVSRDYFHVYQTTPILGRAFSVQDDLPHGPRVAIVSYGLWQRRYGGDRQVIGRTITLSGDSYEVVGVMPAAFAPEIESDLWLPLQADPQSNNFGHYLSVNARLKPGVTLASANAELKLITDQFRAHYGKDRLDPDESFAARSLREGITGDSRSALLILTGAVALVLLIACANVANLLLSRAALRQKEIAIRSAIGASRSRVLRQLLTESVVLAVAGAVLGLALGTAGIRLLLSINPGELPRLEDLAKSGGPWALVDAKVLLFTFGTSLLTGLIFGLAPALHLLGIDLNKTLKDASGRSGTSLHRNRTQSLLVVSEVALAVVLLVGSALLVRTFMQLRNVQLGFNPHQVLTLKVSMIGEKYAHTATIETLSRTLQTRLEAIPGVAAAAPSVNLPLEGSVDLPFSIEGRPAPSDSPYHGDEDWRFIGPHFFSAFRIPLVRGRVFDDHDTNHSAPVIVISEAMARKYWPKENPIGQRVVIAKTLGPDFADQPREIVGVVGSVHENGIDQPLTPVMYIPVSQIPDALNRFANQQIRTAWSIRTTGDPNAVRAAVQQVFASQDNLPVAKVRPMDEVLAETIAGRSFNMLLLTLFGCVALTLAAIGIYGVISYSVQQRTQEIGIRLALGAAQRDVLGLIVSQGARLALIGIAVGLVGAYGLTRVMEKMLFGVKATDPVSFAVIALALFSVALFAAYVPARRASRIDPIVALRYE